MLQPWSPTSFWYLPHTCYWNYVPLPNPWLKCGCWYSRLQHAMFPVSNYPTWNSYFPLLVVYFFHYAFSPFLSYHFTLDIVCLRLDVCSMHSSYIFLLFLGTLLIDVCLLLPIVNWPFPRVSCFFVLLLYNSHIVTNCGSSIPMCILFLNYNSFVHAWILILKCILYVIFLNCYCPR